MLIKSGSETRKRVVETEQVTKSDDSGQNIRIVMYLEIESAKNGASVEDLDSLYTYIAEKCPHMM